MVSSLEPYFYRLETLLQVETYGSDKGLGSDNSVDEEAQQTYVWIVTIALLRFS